MSRRLIVLTAALVIFAACGSSTQPHGTPIGSGPATAVPISTPAITAGHTAAPQAPSSSAPDADPAAIYGFGPQPDPRVTYQPDVVLIGGGPAAIRGMSQDGLVWTLDAGAAGVDQLAVGKVMFASSAAVGRVMRVEPGAGLVDVTLAPVELGEVISDANLVLDQPVALESMAIADVPQIADGYEDVLSEELTGTLPPAGSDRSRAAMPELVITAASARVRSRDERPPVGLASEYSKKFGDWNLTAYRTAGTLGLRAERGVGSSTVQGAEMKVALDTHLEVDDLRVVADIPITRGEVGTSHFRVFGIKGPAISIEAGAVNGLSDNRKIRIEVPVQLKQNVLIGGFPATLTQKFKFLVQTAFTAKNGNLTASAAWDVDGSIGMDGQTVTLPRMTARGAKLIDTLAGISVGVNGIVVAVSFEFGLAIGLPYAGAGPVAAFITSLGLTNGSSLGIVQCKQVSITSTITAGVALQVFDPIKKALKQALGYDVPEQKTLLTQKVLEEAWVKPDVVACRG
jgi:hypothetical protein